MDREAAGRSQHILLFYELVQNADSVKRIFVMYIVLLVLLLFVRVKSIIMLVSTIVHTLQWINNNMVAICVALAYVNKMFLELFGYVDADVVVV